MKRQMISLFALALTAGFAFAEPSAEKPTTQPAAAADPYRLPVSHDRPKIQMSAQALNRNPSPGAILIRG